ncbi:uncharacterized protein hts isoform X2 [Prorops nasuta]|uniref:uncharacterized protein hts isoform X2 n=1 Tax=Prorops nasuta TaxID=863751 RepID=UPI0034CE1D75
MLHLTLCVNTVNQAVLNSLKLPEFHEFFNESKLSRGSSNMADPSQQELTEPHTNGVVDGLTEEEKSKMRPADIDADMREMERRKRVEMMMNSRLFREELERIIETQMKDGAGPSGLLQQISDMMGGAQARFNGSVFKNSNCVLPINDIRGVESMGYAKGEKLLRCKIASVFRLLDLYGWTQGVGGQITARLNQDQEHFLVNPYGLLYHEVTASSLIKVDMQGSVVEQGTTNFGVHVAGFQLHSTIHAARPDIKCIIHLTTPSVTAISSLKCGLLPIGQESIVIGEVSTHQYIGSTLEPEEREKITRNLGPNNKVMLLTNRGALCCGETVEEAFYNVYNTVLACETQLKLMPVGLDNLTLISEESKKSIFEASRKMPVPPAGSVAESSHLAEKLEKRWRIGGTEFEALMRMLDNAGFRTGYIYRHPLVKGEPPRPRNDVEVPPAVSSLGYLLEEEELYKQGLWKGGLRKGTDRTRWLNSPNVYQKVEILETGTPDPKKITKWVSDGSPTHSSTPVKIDSALQFVPKNTNPKEFKQLQQQIKDYRRADKISAGPQSHILEGVTWEEAKKMQDATISGTGEQVVLVGAASKGIIQRGFQHNAMVYKAPYAKNPFDAVTDQELDQYKKEVERKQKGDIYDESQSESEALLSYNISRATHESSTAKSPVQSPISVTSETEEESRDEPRVLRIETKQVPAPCQPEVVLSDDCGLSSSFSSESEDHFGWQSSESYDNLHFEIARCTTIAERMKPVFFEVPTLVPPSWHQHENSTQNRHKFHSLLRRDFFTNYEQRLRQTYNNTYTQTKNSTNTVPSNSNSNSSSKALHFNNAFVSLESPKLVLSSIQRLNSASLNANLLRYPNPESVYFSLKNNKNVNLASFDGYLKNSNRNSLSLSVNNNPSLKCVKTAHLSFNGCRENGYDNRNNQLEDKSYRNMINEHSEQSVSDICKKREGEIESIENENSSLNNNTAMRENGQAYSPDTNKDIPYSAKNLIEHSESKKMIDLCRQDSIVEVIDNIKTNIPVSMIKVPALLNTDLSLKYNLDSTKMSLIYSLTPSSELETSHWVSTDTFNGLDDSTFDNPSIQFDYTVDDNVSTDGSTRDEISDYIWCDLETGTNFGDCKSVDCDLNNSDHVESDNSSNQGSDILELPTSTVLQLKENNEEVFCNGINSTVNEIIDELYVREACVYVANIVDEILKNASQFLENKKVNKEEEFMDVKAAEVEDDGKLFVISEIIHHIIDQADFAPKSSSKLLNEVEFSFETPVDINHTSGDSLKKNSDFFKCSSSVISDKLNENENSAETKENETNMNNLNETLDLEKMFVKLPCPCLQCKSDNFNGNNESFFISCACRECTDRRRNVAIEDGKALPHIDSGLGCIKYDSEEAFSCRSSTYSIYDKEYDEGINTDVNDDMNFDGCDSKCTCGCNSSSPLTDTYRNSLECLSQYKQIIEKNDQLDAELENSYGKATLEFLTIAKVNPENHEVILNFEIQSSNENNKHNVEIYDADEYSKQEKFITESKIESYESSSEGQTVFSDNFAEQELTSPSTEEEIIEDVFINNNGYCENYNLKLDKGEFPKEIVLNGHNSTAPFNIVNDNNCNDNEENGFDKECSKDASGEFNSITINGMSPNDFLDYQRKMEARLDLNNYEENDVYSCNLEFSNNSGRSSKEGDFSESVGFTVLTVDEAVEEIKKLKGIENFDNCGRINREEEQSEKSYSNEDVSNEPKTIVHSGMDIIHFIEYAKKMETKTDFNYLEAFYDSDLDDVESLDNCEKCSKEEEQSEKSNFNENNSIEVMQKVESVQELDVVAEAECTCCSYCLQNPPLCPQAYQNYQESSALPPITEEGDESDTENFERMNVTFTKISNQKDEKQTCSDADMLGEWLGHLSEGDEIKNETCTKSLDYFSCKESDSSQFISANSTIRISDGSYSSQLKAVNENFASLSDVTVEEAKLNSTFTISDNSDSEKDNLIAVDSIYNADISTNVEDHFNQQRELDLSIPEFRKCNECDTSLNFADVSSNDEKERGVNVKKNQKKLREKYSTAEKKVNICDVENTNCKGISKNWDKNTSDMKAKSLSVSCINNSYDTKDTVHLESQLINEESHSDSEIPKDSPVRLQRYEETTLYKVVSRINLTDIADNLSFKKET